MSQATTQAETAPPDTVWVEEVSWFDRIPRPVAMLGLAVAGGIALFHLRLIAEREPAACFRAFLHNVWYGAAIFIGIALDYGLQP